MIDSVPVIANIVNITRGRLLFGSVNLDLRDSLGYGVKWRVVGIDILAFERFIDLGERYQPCSLMADFA